MRVMLAWMILVELRSFGVINATIIHRTHSRTSRNLVYTKRNSFVQLIMGTGVPVPLEDQQAMTVGLVLKAAYGVPNNASYYTNPYVTVQKRSLLQDKPVASRYDIYRSVENALQMIGGKECILRSICETAQVPFHGASLISQILHVIFTPSSTDENAGHSMDRMYEGAWQIGREEQTNCLQIFPHCSKSLTDLLSVTTS